jgi:TusA-related sulfurtransferase
MADYTVDSSIDITDVVCPVTFVRVKVALDEMDDGGTLSIRMNDGEPAQNVPRSVKDDGHAILRLSDNGDGTCDLIVKKRGA